MTAPIQAHDRPRASLLEELEPATASKRRMLIIVNPYAATVSERLRHLVVYAFPRSEADDSSDAGADPRLGVSVGRKVGGAVERTRVKRLLREAFWSTAAELPDRHDFVVVARPAAAELADQGGERAIEESLRDVLRSAGLAPERAA